MFLFPGVLLLLIYEQLLQFLETHTVRLHSLAPKKRKKYFIFLMGGLLAGEVIWRGAHQQSFLVFLLFITLGIAGLLASLKDYRRHEVLFQWGIFREELVEVIQHRLRTTLFIVTALLIRAFPIALFWVGYTEIISHIAALVLSGILLLTLWSEDAELSFRRSLHKSIRRL